MKAIYRNRIYNVLESSAQLTLEAVSGQQFNVAFGDGELVVDPTDYEVAAADNLAQYYGLDEDGALQLQRVLRGVMSISEWENWKATRTTP